MKKFLVLLLITVTLNSYAQNKHAYSLKQALKNAKTDSMRYGTLYDLGTYYFEVNRDTALYYWDQVFLITQKNNEALGEAYALAMKGGELIFLSKFPEALLCLQQALDIAQNPKIEYVKSWYINKLLTDKKSTPHTLRLEVLATIHGAMGPLMAATGDTTRAITEFKTQAGFAEEAHSQFSLGEANMFLSFFYLKINKLDSALSLAKKAIQNFQQAGNNLYTGDVYNVLGELYMQKGDKKLALQYFQDGVAANLKKTNLTGLAFVYSSLTDYYLNQERPDSGVYYARKTVEVLHAMHSTENLADAYEKLDKGYQLQHQTDSMYKYQALALAAKDRSYELVHKSLTDFQKLSFQTQLRLQALEKEDDRTRTRVRTYALLAAICVFMLLAAIFYRNNRQKQKANHLLRKQNAETETQRNNLGQALEELRTTQTQLVQREKMASLGEMTAGIAHEIQNPLNFVNNFSQVSAELVDEMEEELNKGDIEEAKAVGADLKQNLEKIRQHGKRAEGIVKNMLEHSRTGAGNRAPANINTITDEFFKLAYHGLRAKDHSFNAELIERFDENLPKASIVQQDIGRVLVNMFNNAFYAVNQKAKTSGPGYKPTVEVSTETKNGSILIRIRDNGNGIPESIREKIMQPFFTSKPTGEGTGLGLSLSYDIVVKGHGGSIDVNTKEGEFSEFTVTLPLN